MSRMYRKSRFQRPKMSKQHSKSTELEAQAGGAVEEPAASDHPEVEVSQNGAGPKLEIEVDIDALRGELEQLQADVQEHKDKYLRAMAEVENTRRRAENDVAGARKFAIEGFAAEALSVRDSLELALAIEISAADSGVVGKIKEGLELTLKQLDSVFAKFSIKPIDPQPGDKLDPEQHQAMSMQESGEIAANHIVNVVQKGYSIHERLLRPAMVIVAKAKSEKRSEI